MDLNNKNFDYLFKYIIIGDSGVGKSSIVQQFIEGKFKEGHEITVGIEFGSRNIEVNSKIVKLQIWDTAGQEDFRSITRTYYRCSAGALVVYDISRMSTFKSIEDWLRDARQNGNQHMTFLLVGNKSDKENREVTYEQGKQLAEENDMEFIETSAKTSEGIQDAFSNTALQIMEKLENKVIEWNTMEELQQYGIKLNKQGEGKKNNLKLVNQNQDIDNQQENQQNQNTLGRQNCSFC